MRSYRHTLDKVERDIERNDLGKARDRLHGLIQHNPDDLDLRNRLAAIYFRLRDPAMAGRYWYLEEKRTAEIQAAVAAFERSVGYNPFFILRALKFKGNVELLKDGFALRTLLALQESITTFGHNHRFPRPDHAKCAEESFDTGPSCLLIRVLDKSVNALIIFFLVFMSLVLGGIALEQLL